MAVALLTEPVAKGEVAGTKLPGVQAEYVKPPILLNPSDIVTNVEGNAFLQVTVGSWMYGQNGGGSPSSTRPTEIHPTNVSHIKDLLLTQNNEGIATWTVGLDAQQDIAVHDVTRTEGCATACVVIDIFNPATQ